jgi:excisionase family DNA binding protein
MTTQPSLADQIEQTGHALTAQQLAVILGVSPKTIFKQAASHRIPSFRIGSAVRFDPYTVARWFRSRVN